MVTLITGASGYVGRHLVEAFCDQAIYIPTRDDFDFSSRAPIDRYLYGKKITRVIHLASSVVDDPALLFDVNISGLYRFAQSCAIAGVKHFTFASGNNVYPDNVCIPHVESEVCSPPDLNRYGQSKFAGELLVSAIGQAYGMSVTVVRIGDIYGPGQRHGNLIKTLIANAAKGEPIKRYGLGLRRRDYIFISDVVDGLMHISGNELQGVYNLATGKGTSVSEIIDVFAELSGCTIEQVVCNSEDESCVILDIQKLVATGFTPKTSVRQGLKRILEEYK